MKKIVLSILVLMIAAGGLLFAQASDAVIEKWMKEFQPSVLSDKEMKAELQWFADAAKSLRGVSIKSTAEGIKTHYYESEVLAKAFKEITGINVNHDVIGEGELVDRIQRQIQTGKKLYDIYVNDTDNVGWHYRNDAAVKFNDLMKGEGRAFTNPYLDLDDWLNLEQGTDYEGNLLQIPDQQFAILYWFRYDWFSNPDYKAKFKKQFGYDLGVPLNWAAYRDISEFFTNTIGTVDGKKIYGHMDYGKKGPWLGWRISDAFLGIGGMGDKGLPNGLPVDDWGIRVEDGIPKGASVERGGDLNGPAAVYAITYYVDWMKKYADPASLSMGWSEEGPVPAQGHIAQTWYMCLTWLSDPLFADKASAVVDDTTGMPLWRVAPQPHGKYWIPGQKVGYQDAGAWTIPAATVKGKERLAAWMWAQFCVSKSVDLKRTLVGRTFIRKSTIWSPVMDENRELFGGVVDFYRSNQVKLYTGTGLNVPHYPLLAEQFWQNVAPIISGEVTPQKGMDNLAFAIDDLMGKLRMKKKSPALNPKVDRAKWLGRKAADGSPLAPKAEIKGEQKPETISYEDAVAEWVP
jgi:glycerol transport system substrate-binding protein